MSPSGKAVDFDSAIRRFESCHPSLLKIKKSVAIKRVVLNLGKLHNEYNYYRFTNLIQIELLWKLKFNL